MRAIIKPNGVLRILADNQDREDLAYVDDVFRMESVVSEGLHESFDFVSPETIGALTDAPILVKSDDVDYEDDGAVTVQPDADVWFYNLYAIKCPWEHLKRYGYVEFTPA